MGIFLEGEDPCSGHGLGRLVEFRFNPLNTKLNPICHLLALLGAHHILHFSRIRVKVPPGTTSPSITTHTPSGQRNCASWASQPQKSVTLLPCPGGRTTKSMKHSISNMFRFFMTICTEKKFQTSLGILQKFVSGNLAVLEQYPSAASYLFSFPFSLIGVLRDKKNYLGGGFSHGIKVGKHWY